jgi:hypothetical protein
LPGLLFGHDVQLIAVLRKTARVFVQAGSKLLIYVCYPFVFVKTDDVIGCHFNYRPVQVAVLIGKAVCHTSFRERISLSLLDIDALKIANLLTSSYDHP